MTQAANRRAVLGAVLVSGASAAVPAVARATSGPSDAEFAALLSGLEICDADERVFPDEGDYDELEELWDRHWALRARINRIEARTLEGLRAKAIAAALALRLNEDGDCRCDGAFFNLCLSIQKDILAMTAAHGEADRIISAALAEEIRS